MTITSAPSGIGCRPILHDNGTYREGFQISGGPSHSSASRTAAAQKLSSSVWDRRQASTWRRAQSITATRDRKPRCRGMDVGDIRAPHVVRPRDRQVAQQGGRDPVSLVRLRRPGALVRLLPVEIIPPKGGEAGQPTARSTAPAAPSARAEGAGGASPYRASRRPPRAPSPRYLRPPPACCRGCAWARVPGRATPA